MKKPLRTLAVGARAAAGAFLLVGAFSGTVAQELPEDALEDWYRVELLVWLREDTASLGAERWPPLPALAYPADARFLIDPVLADRRLGESDAFASAIDDDGVQHLLLPNAFAPLDLTDRPDSLILEPYVDPATDPAPLSETGVPAPDSDGEAPDAGLTAMAPSGGGATDANEDSPEEAEPEQEAAPRVALAHPYVLLADAALDFRGEARGLRRRGRRVAFHGAWWMHLPPDESMPALFLDRGADLDSPVWPDLQGSVRIDRSRYLHIEIDLWLNTLAEYLPEGWQIPAPPLPPTSVGGRTLTGATLNPWAPEPVPAPGWPAPDRGPAQGVSAKPAEAMPASADAARAAHASDTTATDQEAVGEAENTDASESGQVETPTYPWQHAIVHRQSRRMRSNEVHYLDHPVIGVVVQLRPAGEDLLPVSDEADVAFRELHGLPVDYIELIDDEAP